MYKQPKLRTVNKTAPPFPMNQFPKEFPYLLGKELVYLLATKGKPVLEGPEWEAIFATCIGAEWKPSNVGLDDVVLGNTAWGAKTVKSVKPSSQKNVRLISGRNSIVYSYGEVIDVKSDPQNLGNHVLEIFNERVSSVRQKYKNLRTVVLVKSNELTEVIVFEFETIRYDPDLYKWSWNINKNLIGFNKESGIHKFTWQPHGSQFTILEKVPENTLIIQIQKPNTLNKEEILNNIGFDRSWIKVFKK